MDFLTTILVALFGALGFGAYRYHNRALSKATAKADALAEVVRQNRARAIEEHTTRHEELNDVETRNNSLDLDTLGDTIDAVFGDMSDDAGEGG